MTSIPHNDLYDVSVLFDSRLAAKTAWTKTTRITASETGVVESSLTELGWFRGEPMPLDILETRLVGPAFTPGAAYVALKLGITGQQKIRAMFTNPTTGESLYPDPWKVTALQRVASVMVEKLVSAGGKAVVLHKANAIVKSADQFRAELGDLSNPERRPFLAWLDTTATDDGNGGVVCRSYGMAHYFGAPDVRAALPSADPQSIETAMQAVLFVCERIAGANESPFTLSTVSVPEFRVDEATHPACDWVATAHEADYCIELRPRGAPSAARGGLLRKLFGTPT